MGGSDERRQGGDVGRGHARPVERGVAVRNGRHDIDAGRRDVDVGVGVAEIGMGVGVVGGPDTDHVDERTRIRNRRVSTVARRSDDGDPGSPGRVDRRLGPGRVVGFQVAAEAHVDHVRAMDAGVVDSIEDRAQAAAAEFVEDLDRHDRDAGRHAGNPDRVVRLGGDRPRHVRPVAVVINGIGFPGHLIERRNEAGPDEILVTDGRSGVEDGNHDGRCAPRRRPRRGHPDPGEVGLRAMAVGGIVRVTAGRPGGRRKDGIGHDRRHVGVGSKLRRQRRGLAGRGRYDRPTGPD